MTVQPSMAIELVLVVVQAARKLLDKWDVPLARCKETLGKHNYFVQYRIVKWWLDRRKKMMIHQSIKTAIQPNVTSIVVLSVLSVFAGRMLISEIQEECPEMLSNDYIKIGVLYSMLFLALRDKDDNHILSSAYWCAIIIFGWKYFKNHGAKEFCRKGDAECKENSKEDKTRSLESL